MRNTYLFFSATALQLVLAGPAAAQAAAKEEQAGSATSAASTEAGAADTDGNGDILVTARKREESILRTPISVTALSGEALAERNIRTLADLSSFTPGVNVNGNYSGRADRSQQAVILRSITPNNPLSQTASLFIDGVPVASPTALNTVGDPERIEVLKGPQSAYFGRNTFAGAINVVTREPRAEFGGMIGGLIGTRDNYRVEGAVEGPILGDRLTFRVSALRVARSGSWRNAFSPEETLGDQRTDSGTIQFVAKPTDSLTFKAFGLLTYDHDGPSATGLISAYTVTDAADRQDKTGNIIVQGQSNCVLPGLTSGAPGVGVARPTPYFCGVAPKLAANQPSNNTILDTYVSNFLADPRRRVVSPDNGVKDFGLKRRYYHLHFVADWEIPDTGITLSSLTGYNREYYSQLADTNLYGNLTQPNRAPDAGVGPNRAYYSSPFLIERLNRDFSQELRASYDEGGAFSGTIGASYLKNFVIGDVIGGASTAVFFRQRPAGNASRTTGFFFGLTYKFTDQLQLSLEGRYQLDKLISYAARDGGTTVTNGVVPNGFYPADTPLLEKTYKNFLPRAIIQYTPNDDLMFYASYSKGVNPGAFNNGFLNLGSSVLAAAQSLGIQVAVQPEKITNYEIGTKGKLFDGQVRYSLSAYYAQWRNQINTTFQGVNLGTASAPVFQLVSGSINTGSVDLKGLELDLYYRPNRNLELNFSGAISDSKILKFTNAATSVLTGQFDFRGNENPNTSKYSYTAGIRYGDDIRGLDGASWYSRADLVYKSGVYSNQANVVRTPDLYRVDLRVGVEKGPFLVEAFVINALNNKSYTTIADNFVGTNDSRYSLGANSALIVGLPELRTFGLRGTYRY